MKGKEKKKQATKRPFDRQGIKTGTEAYEPLVVFLAVEVSAWGRWVVYLSLPLTSNRWWMCFSVCRVYCVAYRCVSHFPIFLYTRVPRPIGGMFYVTI